MVDFGTLALLAQFQESQKTALAAAKKAPSPDAQDPVLEDEFLYQDDKVDVRNYQRKVYDLREKQLVRLLCDLDELEFLNSKSLEDAGGALNRLAKHVKGKLGNRHYKHKGKLAQLRQIDMHVFRRGMLELFVAILGRGTSQDTKLVDHKGNWLGNISKVREWLKAAWTKQLRDKKGKAPKAIREIFNALKKRSKEKKELLSENPWLRDYFGKRDKTSKGARKKSDAEDASQDDDDDEDDDDDGKDESDNGSHDEGSKGSKGSDDGSDDDDKRSVKTADNNDDDDDDEADLDADLGSLFSTPNGKFVDPKGKDKRHTAKDKHGERKSKKRAKSKDSRTTTATSRKRDSAASGASSSNAMAMAPLEDVPAPPPPRPAAAPQIEAPTDMQEGIMDLLKAAQLKAIDHQPFARTVAAQGIEDTADFREALQAGWVFPAGILTVIGHARLQGFMAQLVAQRQEPPRAEPAQAAAAPAQSELATLAQLG